MKGRRYGVPNHCLNCHPEMCTRAHIGPQKPPPPTPWPRDAQPVHSRHITDNKSTTTIPQPHMCTCKHTHPSVQARAPVQRCKAESRGQNEQPRNKQSASACTPRAARFLADILADKLRQTCRQTCKRTTATSGPNQHTACWPTADQASPRCMQEPNGQVPCCLFSHEHAHAHHNCVAGGITTGSFSYT